MKQFKRIDLCYRRLTPDRDILVLKGKIPRYLRQKASEYG